MLAFILWKAFGGAARSGPRTVTAVSDPLALIEELRRTGVQMSSPAATQEPFAGVMFSAGSVPGRKMHLVKWVGDQRSSWAYGILELASSHIAGRGTGPRTAELVKDIQGRRSK